MKKKYINTLLIFFVSVTIISCNSSKKGYTSAKERKIWLKDLSICNCIYYAYNKDSLFNKDISFSILTEISDQPYEFYRMLDTLALQKASSIRPSKIGDYDFKKAVLKECLEYGRSKRLNTVIDSLLK